MMKNNLLYIVLLCCVPLLMTAQEEMEMPSEPGKCYAKCVIPEVYEIQTEEVAFYVGNDFKDPNITVYDFIMESGKPRKGLAVIDTTENKEFILNVVKVNKLVKPKTSEWREVICDKDINAEFIQKLATALKQNEFYLGDVALEGFTRDLRIALRQYQKYYDLPVGQIDKYTLIHLGIFL